MQTIYGSCEDVHWREQSKHKFAALGSSPFIASSAEFGKFMVAEADKWAKVVKFAGIKAD